MSTFRRLMTVVLLAGTIAGLALSAMQLVAVAPLIHAAESYEAAEQIASGHVEHESGWQPAEGWERTGYTVLGTVLTGIAFSALLFGVVSLWQAPLTRGRGLWLGLAGFACCALAPALGLPPRPPGVELADIRSAQLWWWVTVFATAGGLRAIGRSNSSWRWRVSGAICLVAPHLIAVPKTTGLSAVPVDLVQRFAVMAMATQLVFWLFLGWFGSYLYMRAFGESVI